MRRLILIPVITLLCGPALALTPFTAVYEARVSGMSARNTLTLAPPDESGIIEFRSVSKAKGFSRLLKHDPIVEYSHFQEVGGRFQPIEYHYLFNQSGSKRDAWIKFDRENLVAKGLYKTETVELDINANHVDRMLEQLVVRVDLMAGNIADRYYTVERNILREVMYEDLGTETIDTKAGKFDTVKYRRQRVGSRRSVIFWFAPELEYLPVRMQHFREDKRTGSVVLKSYALGSVTPR